MSEQFRIPDAAQEALEANPQLGAELRDEAMARVYDAADPAVKAEGKRAVTEVARCREEFTSDDVWKEMRLRPAEPRILGPIMRWAQAQKLVERTDRTVLSGLAQNHRRPIRVWKSLSHRETASRPDVPSQGSTRPPAQLGGYAGFVCAECRAGVDVSCRGPHKPGCSNAWRNEGLQPWRPEGGK